MTQPLSLKIRFLSDWHIGDGAGAQGYVDAIVRRDPLDGLPYLPAKTLTGILRDGCERIVFGLDQGDVAGPWHIFLRLIFGSNQEDDDRTQCPATLAVAPARLPAPLRRELTPRQAQEGAAALRQALIFLKPGVKLDEEGVAQSQMLRFQEMVIAGAELSAELDLALADAQRDQALALLAAGARTVERLGGKRRRGHGRCQLTLDGGPTEERMINLLRQAPSVGAAQSHSHADLVLGQSALPQAERWHVFALELRLESPVLIPAETLGNVVATRDYIPGALLLPALDSWLRQLFGNTTTSALASGLVQIRNAYPGVGPHRLLPVPAALFKLKDGDEITNHLSQEPSDGAQRKQLRKGYVAEDGLIPSRDTALAGKAGVVSVATLAATHATIEDQRQRPTGDVGGVFTYEAIQPMQAQFDCFRAELWIAAELPGNQGAKAMAGWCKRCPATVRIGRAKKDDYGRVSLTCTPVQNPPPPTAVGSTLTLWLVAPLLLRDEALNPVTDATALAQALSGALAKLSPDCAGIVLKPSGRGLARAWRDDGWNNAWQMHRPTRFGLAPGSCFEFHASGDIPAAVIAQLQYAGLGERSGEGYGEVRVNPPLLRDAVPAKSAAVARPARGQNQVPCRIEPDEFTDALQQRAARLVIERQVFLTEAAFRRGLGWQKGSPRNTQLGALRSLFETLRGDDDRQRIQDWASAVRRNRRRGEQWPAVSFTLLDEHLHDDHAIWRQLGLAENGALPQWPEQGAEELRRHLRDVALRTLWLVAISNQLRENNLPDELHQTQEAARGA